MKHVARIEGVSEHVAKVIRERNHNHECLCRAVRGAKWLDEHGPRDWRLQVMDITDGHISSRIDFRHNDFYPLSLAFEGDERFSSRAGAPRWIRVAEIFKFDNPHMNLELKRHGFNEESRTVGDTVITEAVDGQILTAAWRGVLNWYSALGSYDKVEMPILMYRSNTSKVFEPLYLKEAA